MKQADTRTESCSHFVQRAHETNFYVLFTHPLIVVPIKRMWLNMPYSFAVAYICHRFWNTVTRFLSVIDECVQKPSSRSRHVILSRLNDNAGTIQRQSAVDIPRWAYWTTSSLDRTVYQDKVLYPTVTDSRCSDVDTGIGTLLFTPYADRLRLYCS